MTLFDRLTHGGMKDSIQAEVLRKQGEGLVLKEIYLALGRVCELVFAGSRGQKDTLVLRSAEVVAQQHIHEFSSLFAELPPSARRTGVDATLHRISAIPPHISPTPPRYLAISPLHLPEISPYLPRSTRRCTVSRAPCTSSPTASTPSRRASAAPSR